MLSPGLYVVATPIGNLEDISYRAVRVLSEVSCIAAEDTRHSRILLDHYSINTSLISLHEHNERDRVPGLVKRIRGGEAIALISDAGTPLISDPGFRLVRALADEQLPVFTIPGASALTAALAVGGLASDRFLFQGFLPARRSARRERLAALANQNVTIVFYEASHRIKASLADMLKAFGPGREAAVCRELTKKFETVSRGSLAQLSQTLESDPDQCKGEFVILVAGDTDSGSPVDGLELATALHEHVSASQAAKIAAKITGGSRRELYKAREEK